MHSRLPSKARDSRQDQDGVPYLNCLLLHLTLECERCFLDLDVTFQSNRLGTRLKLKRAKARTGHQSAERAPTHLGINYSPNRSRCERSIVRPRLPSLTEGKLFILWLGAAGKLLLRLPSPAGVTSNT